MTELPPSPQARDSTLGRLLQELSWVGSNIRAYRDGGRGFENVLTAEVFTVLDYLPRTAFLGAVIASATGAAEARRRVVEEIETAELTLLPDELMLHRPPTGGSVVVQPDGILVSPSCYVLIEAKRIRRSSFQKEQLAREYAAVCQEAQARTPLLLLLLGAPPPVLVAGEGRLSVEEAVARHLGKFSPPAELPRLLDELRNVVAWTTWAQLRQVVESQAVAFRRDDDSVAGSVARLSGAVTDAVRRHAEPDVRTSAPEA